MSSVEFGSLFRFIRNGMNIKQDKSGNGLPITRIETIANGDVSDSRVGYAGLSEKDCTDWLLQPGDILFSHINSVEHLGKCAVYRGNPQKLIHGMNLLCLRCDDTKLVPEFAKYLIRAPHFRARLSNFINKAVNQASISIGNLKTVQVYIPTLADQQRIAAILDKAEEIRTKRSATLAQIDLLAQTVFLDIFGHPATNPKKWPIVSIGSVADIIVPTRDKPKKFTGNIPWVTLPDLDGLFVLEATNLLTTQEADEVGNRLIPPNSVLLSCAGTLGKVAITGFPVYANQQFYGLIPRKSEIDPVYLALCLKVIGESFFSRLGGAFTIGFFSKQKALDIKIPLPPLSLQRDFAVRVAVVEKLKATHRASKAKLDGFFAVLQDCAFTGKL